MLHLIDDSVLENDRMTTNDGTLNGYIEFAPEILLHAPNRKTGSFVE